MKKIKFILLITIIFSQIALTQNKGNDMNVSKESFGKTKDGKEVFLYTLTNRNGMKVKITNYGGIVTELWVPDNKGVLADVVLGFDNLNGYTGEHPYFGCIVGRYGNRIARGKFKLDGTEYTLARNNGNNHLHGGLKGFDKVVWEAREVKTNDGIGVSLKYKSRDGEEGYPGNLDVMVSYLLTDKDELRIEYEAKTDKSTPINLTHHSYFNLAGAGSGDILNHEMTLKADRYTVVDADLIPTGELREAAGTPMDFQKTFRIGKRIASVEGGYDHNYVLVRSGNGLELGAKVAEESSGRVMEVYTTEPGIQFYSGNFLDGSIKGKNGMIYKKHSGFCLEAQHFPDTPNQPSFPNVILHPGEKYSQTTTYRFSVVK